MRISILEAIVAARTGWVDSRAGRDELVDAVQQCLVQDDVGRGELTFELLRGARPDGRRGDRGMVEHERETEILETALSMRRSGRATFHGFALAQCIRGESRSRSLTAHGTLYKALGRLEEFGLLTSHWEHGEAAEGRPRRRLYELTKQGAEVAEQALAGKAENAAAGVGRPGRVVPGSA